MAKLSNTEAKLKRSVTYKKRRVYDLMYFFIDKILNTLCKLFTDWQKESCSIL